MCPVFPKSVQFLRMRILNQQDYFHIRPSARPFDLLSFLAPSGTLNASVLDLESRSRSRFTAFWVASKLKMSKQIKSFPLIEKKPQPNKQKTSPFLLLLFLFLFCFLLPSGTLMTSLNLPSSTPEITKRANESFFA